MGDRGLRRRRRRLRVYARFTDPELCAAAEETELVGCRLRLTPQATTLPNGTEVVANAAVLA